MYKFGSFIRLLNCKLCLLLTLLPTATSLRSQECVSAVRPTLLSHIVLDEGVDNLSVFDDFLLISSGRILYRLPLSNLENSSLSIDTFALRIDDHIDYMTQSASCRDTFYYTTLDAKGNSLLYQCIRRPKNKFDKRRIKWKHFSSSVEHPVLTDDGKIMVFSSDNPIGFGGKDLWYSVLKNGVWSDPRNMGHLVNSDKDESMPFLFGQHLFFSSNGRADSRGGADLYVTRLIAPEQTGDTVMMLPIGRCAVLNMNTLFSTQWNDKAFIFSQSAATGIFLSTGSDDKAKLYACSNPMNWVHLVGSIVDTSGSTIENTTIILSCDGQIIATSRIDKAGYEFVVEQNRPYSVEVSAPNFFKSSRIVTPARTQTNSFFEFCSLNFVLHSFQFSHLYRYPDLFGSPVATDLSFQGRKRLDYLAQYLVENPHLSLLIVSEFRQSADSAFCDLVNQARLSSLTQYLVAHGVASSAIQTRTSIPSGRFTDDPISFNNATQASSLTVGFVLLNEM